MSRQAKDQNKTATFKAVVSPSALFYVSGLSGVSNEQVLDAFLDSIRNDVESGKTNEQILAAWKKQSMV